MFPDLGSYAVEVLSAYAGTLALLLILVASSVWQGRKTRIRLEEFEARRTAKRQKSTENL
ncbi:heme exporter protein CcmD [Rhodobacterales bacterium HKCCD6035]|nr:heme exporter protein CcmD [Rhodobacterales bacterium HKCCD6035]